jgi:hypothetical protein
MHLAPTMEKVHEVTDLMVEQMCERIDENHGDPDGGSITERAWTSEQERDLESMVEAAVREWQTKHNIIIPSWQFSDTRASEFVDIEHPEDARNRANCAGAAKSVTAGAKGE